MWRVCIIAAVSLARGADVESPGFRPSSRPAVQQPGLPGQARPQQSQSVVGSTSRAIGDVGQKFSRWYRAYQGFVAGAAKVSHIISAISGCWLLFATPFSIIGSAFTLRVDEVILIGYLALYAVLMVGMELPLSAVQRVLQQYFFFVFTRPGRGLFVLHVATVTWACKHIGFATKALMVSASAER